MRNIAKPTYHLGLSTALLGLTTEAQAYWELTTYHYTALIFLILLLLAAEYYWRIYRNPLTLKLTRNPTTLLHLPIDQLAEAKRLLELTQRLNTILEHSNIHPSYFEEAVDFLDLPFEEQAELIAHRANAQYAPLSDHTFTLRFRDTFPLNIQQALLYFPEPYLEHTDIITRLQTHRQQPTLIIALNPRHQKTLLPYTTDPTNNTALLTFEQLTHYLLTPQPIEILSQILTSQWSLRLLSPYQTRTPVTKDNLFFGRQTERHILTTNPPNNYLICGGTQLGKTSLLHYLKRHCHPQNGIQCHNFSLLDNNLNLKLAATLGLPNLNDLTETLTRLKQINSGQRYFLIDDIDHFITQDRQQNYQQLKQLQTLSTQGICHFIIAGGWQLYYHTHYQPDPTLQQFGKHITLQNLNKTDSETFIQTPLNQLNIQLIDTPTLTETLYTLTAGRPNLIAYLTNHLLQTIDPTKRQITPDHLNQLLNNPTLTTQLKQICTPTLTQLERDILNHLHTTPQLQLTDLTPQLNPHYTPEEIHAAITHLLFNTIITQHPQTNTYQLIPLLQTIPHWTL